MKNTTQEQWLSASVFYENTDFLLSEVVVTLAQELQEEGIASDFMFNRSWERGKHILLLFKTTQHETLKQRLSERLSVFFDAYPAPEKELVFPINDWFLPFPNNHVHYSDNFLTDVMETGGLQAALAAESLLTHSSHSILNFIQEAGGEWEPESSIGIAIQLHLGLVHGFKMSLEEIKAFYAACFRNMLGMTQAADGNEDFQASLLQGLDETFEMQKESLVQFSEYLLATLDEGEAFEDEWLNKWIEVCASVNERIVKLQESGQFVAPERFEVDHNLAIPVLNQERWPVVEYYLRAIDCQLGITDIFELNLMYSIKESIQALAEQNNV